MTFVNNTGYVVGFCFWHPVELLEYQYGVEEFFETVREDPEAFNELNFDGVTYATD